MPPKNKGKKPSKSRTPNLINGLTKDELSKEQMEEYIMQLREELDREREERNYFQLERDKIFSFWEISKRELEEVRAGLTNVHKNIEEDEACHQVEIKVYKEKMKHLLYEHENTMSELKADGLVTTEAMQKEQENLEANLHMEKEARIVDLQEVDNEKLAMELEQQKHNEEMTRTRKSWQKQLAEIRAEYEKKLSLLPQEVDNLRKNQMSEREDHWNSHIAALKEDHHQAIAESSVLIEYIQHDADMNVSLKIQIKDMKMKQKQKEKELIPILQDNRHLAKQLLKLEEEITENEKKMKNFTIKKSSDDVIEKAKIKERNHLKSDYEALEQKFTQLQLERDELYNTFDQRVQKVQQKGDEKIQQLEDQMKALTDNLEKTQAQISSVLSVSNVDQTAFDRLAENIEENLNTSNSTIKQLQFQISQISKARMDLLLTYEAKQRLLGVPVEELCVKPLENSLTGNPEMRSTVSDEIKV